MILILYRALGAPLAALCLPFLALVNRKVRRGLRLRMLKRRWPQFRQAPLWIHAASGEFEYAKPVIREHKTRFPEVPIVVTYFSPTFALSVENFPGVDFALPLPLDLPGPCASFLRKLNPRRALIARTDIWPELLTQARRRGIPIEVFSYTQRPSVRPWLARFRAGLVDEIWCVAAEDKQLLETLKIVTPTAVGGDTRYDQVRFRLDHPKPLPGALKPKKRCLVAGSTWGEDERILLPALAPLLQAGSLQLILVPHEPTPAHIESLRRDLRLLGLSYALYSSAQPWDDKAVLLVDKVGILAELYLWGDLAFVGGSFKRSVHSVMEALGAGCETFIGPLHTGNREALEFQRLTVAGRAPVICVRSLAEFQDAVRKALEIPGPARAEFTKGLIALFASRLGATAKLVSRLGSSPAPRTR